MSREDEIKKLISIHHRHLQKLREQQASLWSHTPPHILIEIEDREAAIEELETELKALEDNSVDEESPNIQISKQRVQIATSSVRSLSDYKKGDLLWYCHDGRQVGTAKERLKKVGNGWGNFKFIFSGGQDVIYAVQMDGLLLWYRHKGWQDGKEWWRGKKVVGNGWSNFKFIFSGGQGVIYAVQSDGSLLWYRHDGWEAGTEEWSEEYGKPVGADWSQFKFVFSGGKGVIYAVKPDGSLLWYRHDGWQTGTEEWSNQGARKSINNTDGRQFEFAFCGGEGVIYAVGSNGTLLEYRRNGWLEGKEMLTGETVIDKDIDWRRFEVLFSGGEGRIYAVI